MTLAPLSSFALALAVVAAVPEGGSQFSASVSETHFAATNPNDYSVLMILGDAVHGARAQMLVAPFASFETSFPQGTLDDLYVEVVFFAPTGVRSSGSVSFDTMMIAQAEYLEVEPSGDQLQPYIYSGNMRMPADAAVLLAPAAWLDANASTTQPLLYDPTHVPVITPEETEADEWAPKIQSSNPSL